MGFEGESEETHGTEDGIVGGEGGGLGVADSFEDGGVDGEEEEKVYQFLHIFIIVLRKYCGLCFGNKWAGTLGKWCLLIVIMN